MSSKLLMNNNGGGNMQMQKGIVTATVDNQEMTITGLSFIPNIIFVRIISDIPTSACSLCWVYTPYARFSIRTDSGGISSGITGKDYYADKGYTVGTSKIELVDEGFKFLSIDISYGPIRQGDQFEWVAIKYE